MPRSLRFALFADPSTAKSAFDELSESIHVVTGLRLTPIYVSSYPGLAQALESGACDAAWLPPLVAQSLLATATGKPIAAVGRKGRTSYFSVLVARDGIAPHGVRSLVRSRIGWVSKLSAAGYVVPALYLRSLGLEPNEMFTEQTFFGSHDRVARALECAEVNVCATYATIARGGRTLDLPERFAGGSTILVAAGPIPGDVVFTSAALDPDVRETLRRGFLALYFRPDGPLATLMSVDRFEVPSLDHFDTLARWQRRAVESEPRMPAEPSLAGCDGDGIPR